MGIAFAEDAHPRARSAQLPIARSLEEKTLSDDACHFADFCRKRCVHSEESHTHISAVHVCVTNFGRLENANGSPTRPVHASGVGIIACRPRERACAPSCVANAFDAVGLPTSSRGARH
jgi:hypothetical protein